MKTQEEIEQLAEQIANKHSKQNGEIIGNPRAIMLGTEAIQAVKDGYTQCQQDMADEISRFLRENLKVVIKQNLNFSNRTKASFDVIVMLEGEEISTTDFTIYS